MNTTFNGAAQTIALSQDVQNTKFRLTGWDFAVAAFVFLYFFDSIFPASTILGHCG